MGYACSRASVFWLIRNSDKSVSVGKQQGEIIDQCQHYLPSQEYEDRSFADPDPFDMDPDPAFQLIGPDPCRCA